MSDETRKRLLLAAEDRTGMSAKDVSLLMLDAYDELYGAQRESALKDQKIARLEESTSVVLIMRLRNQFDEQVRRAELAESQLSAAQEAIKAMADDGWLYHGPEGMSDVQKKVYAIYQAIAAAQSGDK